MSLQPDIHRILKATEIMREFLSYFAVPVVFSYAQYYVQTPDKVSFTQEKASFHLQPHYHVNFDAAGNFLAIIYSIPPKLKLNDTDYLIFFARQSTDGKRIFFTAEEWLREVAPFTYDEASMLMRSKYRNIYF